MAEKYYPSFDLNNHALAEVWRGDILECIHAGAIAEVDSSGTIISYLGDPHVITSFRSAAKPLQAIPVVTLPGSEKLNLSSEELAICCASHPGEPRHSALAASVLALSGFMPDYLVCGPAGRHGSPLDHGCSGNHAAILLAAHLLGASLEGYHLPDHPVQLHLKSVILNLSRSKDVLVATDGCGIPTFGLTLASMAVSFAALVDSTAPWSALGNAMASHPDLVGSLDRVDVRLMEVSNGRIIAKTGAEGLLCLGCRKTGRGMAVKILDGANRALGPIAIEYLARRDWITDEEAADDRLAALRRPKIHSSTGHAAAEIRPSLP